MWKVFLLMFIIIAVISYLWVRAIDNMHKKFPNYKGEDFLNWGEEEMKQKHELPEWDDNQVHTEGKFH